MKIILLFLLIVNGFYGAVADVDQLSVSSLIKMIFKSNEFQLADCSSNFVLKSNSNVYEKTKPIEVTFESKSFDRTFRDLILYVEDHQGHFVGQWKSDDSQLISLSNRTLVDISQRSQTQVQALWYPESDLIGDVSIKAIAVENNSMLLIDCYKIQVKSGIKEFIDDSSSTISLSNKKTSAASSPTVDVAMNVTWTFDGKTKVTNVRMTIINLKSAEWAAIGLGIERAMGRAHVFLCKRLADDTITVSRYINPNGHQYPEPAPSDAGGLFTPGEQRFNDGIVTCQFTLSDFTESNQSDVQTVPPLSQSSLYYPLFAVGLLDSDNDPQRHPKDSRKAQSELVQLNKKEIILYKLSNGNTIDSRIFIRVHGTLMIITWLFLVSNGILVSRYFRTIEFRGKISSQLSWFYVHRLMMTMASISTVVSFIFIFSALQGSWIERGWTCAFVHSILGIIVITFTFLQPFIALFRCSTTSTYRFIFNILHRTIGIVSFLMAKIVLFLATYLRQFSNPFARILVISWFVWIILIFVIFESIDYYFRRKSSNSVYTTIEQSSDQPLTRVNSTTHRKASTGEKRGKLVLLILHMFVAGLLSIALGLCLYFS